jgi:hypothetical protein
MGQSFPQYQFPLLFVYHLCGHHDPTSFSLVYCKGPWSVNILALWPNRFYDKAVEIMFLAEDGSLHVCPKFSLLFVPFQWSCLP